MRLARTPDDVKAATQAIRQIVGRHVDDIAGKYLIAGETQDTALMFVPSESIFAVLQEQFSDLVQKAYRARVMIVAPNVLMLAVQTVQSVIKDVKMRDHAGVIQREVGLLTRRRGPADGARRRAGAPFHVVRQGPGKALRFRDQDREPRQKARLPRPRRRGCGPGPRLSSG